MILKAKQTHEIVQVNVLLLSLVALVIYLADVMFLIQQSRLVKIMVIIELCSAHVYYKHILQLQQIKYFIYYCRTRISLMLSSESVKISTTLWWNLYKMKTAQLLLR